VYFIEDHGLFALNGIFVGINQEAGIILIEKNKKKGGCKHPPFLQLQII
jgi:hypothetical protein